MDKTNRRRHSWVRWALAVLFVALQVVNFLRIDAHSHSVSDTIRPFLIESVLLGALFWALYSLTNSRNRIK